MNRLIKALVIVSAAYTSSAWSEIAVANQTSDVEPNDYQFAELEQVDRITRYQIDGWQYVDARSLIVDVSPRRSYLLILDRPTRDLRFADAIQISSTGSSVHARFDTVRALDRNHFNIPVSIERIYKLEGREQRKQVKESIRVRM